MSLYSFDQDKFEHLYYCLSYICFFSGSDHWNAPEQEELGFRGRGGRGELGKWVDSSPHDFREWRRHPIIALGKDTTTTIFSHFVFVCV